MHYDLRRAWGALVRLAVGAVAAALIAAPAVAQTAKAKLSFMYLPVADYAPFFVAKEKGYFDQLGLDVTLVPKDATSETIPLLASGKVVAGGSSWGASVFNAANMGASVSVVAQFARMPTQGKPPARFMISEKLWKEGVRDAGGLKGRRVGVLGAGALTVYFAGLALQQAGLTLDDVQMVNLPMPAFGQAFVNGGIDAGVVFEPFATLFERDAIARPLPSEFANGVEMGFILVNSEFLKTNENAVVRLVAGTMRASRELQAGGWKDPATREFIRKYVKLDTSVIDQIGLAVAAEDAKLDVKSVKAQEAFFQSRGLLAYKGAIDFNRFYRPDIPTKAAALLGAQR